MSSYTYTQLYGAGSVGETLRGLKTFTFTNPSSSAYFTMEVKRNQYGAYSGDRITNLNGSYIIPEFMGAIISPHIVSVVVPPGVSSFEFIPERVIKSGLYYLRGTGMYSLVIS